MDDTSPTPQQLLDLALPANDSGATTVRGYLIRLLTEVWREEEGFDGKRPFGNSSWQSGDVYDAMAKAGIVEADPPEPDGYVSIKSGARAKAEELILAAIASLATP